MEVTVFNQRMVFEVVNMTTIVIPPLEEPEWEVCSIHVIMEVEKPRMTFNALGGINTYFEGILGLRNQNGI